MQWYNTRTEKNAIWYRIFSFFTHVSSSFRRLYFTLWVLISVNNELTPSSSRLDWMHGASISSHLQKQNHHGSSSSLRLNWLDPQSASIFSHLLKQIHQKKKINKVTTRYYNSGHDQIRTVDMGLLESHFIEQKAGMKTISWTRIHAQTQSNVRKEGEGGSLALALSLTPSVQSRPASHHHRPAPYLVVSGVVAARRHFVDCFLVVLFWRWLEIDGRQIKYRNLIILNANFRFGATTHRNENLGLARPTICIDSVQRDDLHARRRDLTPTFDFPSPHHEGWLAQTGDRRRIYLRCLI